MRTDAYERNVCMFQFAAGCCEVGVLPGDMVAYVACGWVGFPVCVCVCVCAT